MIQIDEHIFQMGWFNHQVVHFLGSDLCFQDGDDLGWDFLKQPPRSEASWVEGCSVMMLEITSCKVGVFEKTSSWSMTWGDDFEMSLSDIYIYI